MRTQAVYRRRIQGQFVYPRSRFCKTHAAILLMESPVWLDTHRYHRCLSGILVFWCLPVLLGGPFFSSPLGSCLCRQRYKLQDFLCSICIAMHDNSHFRNHAVPHCHLIYVYFLDTYYPVRQNPFAANLSCRCVESIAQDSLMNAESAE